MDINVLIKRIDTLLDYTPYSYRHKKKQVPRSCLKQSEGSTAFIVLLFDVVDSILKRSDLEGQLSTYIMTVEIYRLLMRRGF